MKILKSTIIFAVGILLFATSCRTEDDVAIDPPQAETLVANSTTANLVSRTALNDGSMDNIIDSASCLSVELPVTVTVNGTELQITDASGYQAIEDIIDMFNDDTDTIVITYPITVVFPDFTTMVVNSDTELASVAAANCLGENENDEDIECIDFQYPITASVFDANNELINTITINNDNDIYNFIKDLDQFAAVTVSFPITATLADGSTQTINSIQELQDAIEAADDTCDEDDDNDFDDDDCNDCTTEAINSLFASCTQWTVEELRRNNQNLEDNYSNFTFTFNSDGTITATDGTNTHNGTWEAIGTANNISFTITITNLPDFNGTWTVNELEQESGEAEIGLKMGDDELEFESNC